MPIVLPFNLWVKYLTCSYKEFIEGPRVVTLAELQKAARSKKDKSDHFLAVIMDKRCEMLSNWVAKCHGEGFSLHCGALGNGASVDDGSRRLASSASSSAPAP